MTLNTIRQALRIERRLIARIVLACLVAALVASLVWPHTYHATATILVDTSRITSNFDIGIQSSQQLQRDFIALAGERPILLAACSAAGVSCSATERAHPDIELGRRVSVEAVKGTSLLGVTGSAATAAASAALANGVARAMIAADQAEVRRLLAQARNSITSQLAQLDSEVTSAENAIKADRPGSGAVSADQAKLTALNSRYAAIVARQTDLLDLQNRLLGIATVVQPASPAPRPWAPDPPLYMLAALGVGVVLGAGTVLTRQLLDDRILDAQALALAAGAPVTRVAITAGSGLPYALAYAAVVGAHPETRKVLIAGASAKDQTSTVAAGLGSAAAEAGHRALVLHCDGFSWTSRQPWPDRPGGGVLNPPIPADGNADAVLAALATADGEFDVALLSVPSPFSSPVPIWMARLVDQVVLVATEGASRHADARQSAELIRQAGGRVTASVLMSRRGRSVDSPLTPSPPSGPPSVSTLTPPRRSAGRARPSPASTQRPPRTRRQPSPLDR